MNVPLGFLLVFPGSGLGGMIRHGVGLASLRLLGPNFPYGTLIINIIGSALMGFAVGLFATRSLGSELRLFLTTGIIGGFTTWSTFSLDTVTLWGRGQRWRLYDGQSVRLLRCHLRHPRDRKALRWFPSIISPFTI